MCADFRKINCVLNNFAFGVVNHAVFLRRIDDQLDFFFGMGFVVFVGNAGSHQPQDAVGDMVKHPDERRKNLVEQIQRPGN